MMDEEEIVKALSLEEKALDEFKRRKYSLPQPQTSSKSSEGLSNDQKVFNKYQKSFAIFQILATEKDRSRSVRPA